MWERKLSLKVEILTRRSLERRDSEGSANFTLTRLRMQEGPKNTADAVLRPTKGGLRFSVTHKFAFLVQTDPIVSGRFVRGRDQRSTGWHAS